MAQQNYTKEEFIDAYNSSTTKTELLLKLGLSPESTKVIYNRCEEYGLDISKLRTHINYKISDEEFTEIVKKSTSKRQALIELGVVPKGGNYAVFDKRVEKLNLDISHFTGQGWNKGQTIGPKRPIEDYLSNKYSITSNKLRRRLIHEEYFEQKCYKCGNTEWNGEPIPLELEHINGNHQDNSLENLTILCPNCHAQTDTYRGKNIKN